MPADPDPSPTALQTAARLIAAGRSAEAARELNALVRAAPTYAAAYVLLAKAREATGDRVRALDAWHRAYFLVPSSPLVKRERQRLLDTMSPPTRTEELAHPLPDAPDAAEPETAPSAPIGPEADSDASGEESEPSALVLPPLLDRDTESEPEAPEADAEGWTRTQSDDADLLPSLDPIETQPAEAVADPTGDAPPQEGDDLDTDLDALIRDLEHAPRIRPDPNFQGPDPLAHDEEPEEMASETLAQIYAAQKQYAEAANVYEKLARQRPDRAAEMQQRADEMRERASQ